MYIKKKTKRKLWIPVATVVDRRNKYCKGVLTKKKIHLRIRELERRSENLTCGL